MTDLHKMYLVLALLKSYDYGDCTIDILFNSLSDIKDSSDIDMGIDLQLLREAIDKRIKK